MNTDFKVEYKKWIQKLSKPNFDELILNYVKEYYETKDAYISDGPYDGGVDLIFSIDKQEYKRNIQITVQEENYEKKLDEDLRKAKENVSDFGYLNNLDFYISQAITPDKKKKLVKNADIKYQITLKIIDANELAGLANEYKSIWRTLQKFNKSAFPEEKFHVDQNTKILFDTLSMSRDITTIKNSFVHSLILTYLFNNPEQTVEQIFIGLRDAFFGKYDKVFFETEIGRLKAEAKINSIEDASPKKFILSDKTQSSLEEISENSKIHEAKLFSEFKNVLQRYRMEKETENILNLIVELYNANYEIDENEVINGGKSHDKKIQSIFNKLINQLQKEHKIDNQNANNIARQLLVLCKNNEFLNKTSISKMFTNLFKSDKLDEYLNTSKRKVYLDTQILLQIICCKYDEIEYEDSLYNAVRYFIDTVDSSDIPICLHTTIGYIEEVAWHILNGLKLERFLELDFIWDLGPSKNVFFNFYLELKKNYDIEAESFSDFVEELFDVNGTNYNNTTFIEELIQNLVERFELSGIVVETPHIFDNYDKYRKEYEVSLSYLKHDQKSYEARKHDLNTILHLSEMHFDTDEGYFTEPFFITWDTSFYEVRSSFRKFKELKHWYLYPPMKFANTISVINMKIDSTAINYNIVSLVEENFNLSNDSISFIDLVNGLFTDKDVKKWKLVDKLAKLRKRLVKEANLDDFNKARNNSLPIDELLLLIQKYYQNPSNGKRYKDLTCLFQNNDFADRLSKLLEDNLKDFQIRNKIKKEIIESIDVLIKENNEAQCE